MKMIKITNEEILSTFKEYNGMMLTEKETELLNTVKSGKMSVDCNGDIVSNTASGRYWITTEPTIHLWNKASDYEVRMIYRIHKDSKYSAVLFETER